MRITKFCWSVVLVSCLASTPAWTQELKFTTQDFPPFSYSTNGVVSGPAVDLIRRVCAEMNTKCSFRLLPWTRAQQQVKNGEANGMGQGATGRPVLVGYGSLDRSRIS